MIAASRAACRSAASWSWLHRRGEPMLPLSRRRALVLLASLPAPGAAPLATPRIRAAGRGPPAGAELPEGRLVVRADGAIFLIEGGHKHLVQPIGGVGDDEIEAVPDGEPLFFLSGRSSGQASAGPAPRSASAGISMP